jgi:glycosyl transferase family 25
MSRLSGLLGISDIEIERISAIDGNNLNEVDLAYWQLRSRVWAPLTAQEIACFLSHRKVWKLVVERLEPWAFVCEDDIHVSEAHKQFMKTPAWLPAKADIVKAETTYDRVEFAGNTVATAFGHALRKLTSEHLGAAGYFISRDACKRLLQLTEECCEPVDCLLFSTRAPIMRQLEIYQIDPALCVQDRFLVREGRALGLATQIPLTRFNKVPPRGLKQWARRLLREAMRPVRQFLGFVRRMALTAMGRAVFKVVSIDLGQG